MDKTDYLGRKIEDLVEENKLEIKNNEEIVEVDIEKITRNPSQPRTTFNPKTLKKLAESIEQHGVLQPIIVKPGAEGYILVAGERRVRASVIAGKKSIPSIIRDYNSIYLAELSILENVQRDDLTPIEEALAYAKAIKELKITQAELAKKIGKSRSHVTNMVGLLNLPPSVINDVNDRTISMGHARVLSKISNQETILALAKRIKAGHLTVRKLESLASKAKNKTFTARRNLGSLSSNLAKTYATQIEEALNNSAKVRIVKNEIRLIFTDEDHLNGIIKILSKLKE